MTIRISNQDMMDEAFLEECDKFIIYVNSPYIITSGYRKGDSGDHGRGKAIDIIFDSSTHSLFDIYLMAERFKFNAIGVYPEWSWKGKNFGGLHLGYRNVPTYGARWMRTGSSNYIALNERNMFLYVFKKHSNILH